MRTRLFHTMLLALLVSVTATGQQLRTGDISPDFSLPFATKDSISRSPLRLSDVAESTLVLLAFYPADWSSGCTKELCTLRDDMGELQQLDIEILAISGDYVYSHHAWAKHHDLPFRLLSDHTHEVARAFGTFNETTGFTRRSVFVVGPGMDIRYADQEYSVRDEDDYKALKQAIREMGRQ